MKTIRIKYKRRLTSRGNNNKSKKCRQSIRQKKCKTKKIYHYRKNNKLLYQSGGEFSDDDDAGEEEASQEDIALAMSLSLSPRVKEGLQELYKYRGHDSVTKERCMEYPSKNTLFGKVLEEQFAEHFFKTHFPIDGGNLFAKYLQLIATAEHDIPPYLTGGRGAISIKSKRIGNQVKKSQKIVKITDNCSFQICSADAVRFVNQILIDQPLTLVIIYYDIDATPGVLQPDGKTRAYNIQTHRNTIWGGYTTPAQRVNLATRIKELSRLFSIAQDIPDVIQITKKIVDIKRSTELLQYEMNQKQTLFKLAPKISSKCGKKIGSCKHQCRLQVVLNVKDLAEAAPFIHEPGSPTSIRGKGASFSSFGVAKTPARAKTPASTRGQRAKTPASARGQSRKPPASETSARGQRAKTPASSASAGRKSRVSASSRTPSASLRSQPGAISRASASTSLRPIPENSIYNSRIFQPPTSTSRKSPPPQPPEEFMGN